MKKENVFGIVSSIYVACLLVSNILASKMFAMGNIILPTAVILFPVVYILNDVLTEIFGYTKAKQAIILGFVINLFAVIAYNIAIILPAPVFAQEMGNAFAMVLGSTARILLASFVAYLVGTTMNAKVMQKMKDKNENTLMFRCIASTFIGEGLDAALFITIAFIGAMPLQSLLVMIVSQWIFKTLFEIVFFPITKVVIGKMRQLQ
jgi:uncharacterized integral membrane protein (TIGR00697 family)